jgi:hypothetical protein
MHALPQAPQLLTSVINSGVPTLHVQTPELHSSKRSQSLAVTHSAQLPAPSQTRVVPLQSSFERHWTHVFVAPQIGLLEVQSTGLVQATAQAPRLQIPDPQSIPDKHSTHRSSPPGDASTQKGVGMPHPSWSGVEQGSHAPAPPQRGARPLQSAFDKQGKLTPESIGASPGCSAAVPGSQVNVASHDGFAQLETSQSEAAKQRVAPRSIIIGTLVPSAPRKQLLSLSIGTLPDSKPKFPAQCGRVASHEQAYCSIGPVAPKLRKSFDSRFLARRPTNPNHAAPRGREWESRR